MVGVSNKGYVTNRRGQMTSKRELTYEDLKNIFSKEDLNRNDKLCLTFAELTAGKNNIQLWEELVEADAHSKLGQTLEEIQEIRKKYDLYPELGEVFFSVYRRSWGKYGCSKYESVSW
jgi:poly(A) polymerase Pap1